MIKNGKFYCETELHALPTIACPGHAEGHGTCRSPYNPETGRSGIPEEHAAQDLDKPNTVAKGAFKLDTGKVRMSLLIPSVLWGIAQIREFGASKYGTDDGWRDVTDPIRRYKDAMDRHWRALVGEGMPFEDHDPESKLHHAYHFACNAMFLAWFTTKHPTALAEFRKRQENR